MEVVNTGQQSPYVMTISLNVFKHLGLNLYSNIPAVLSEIVANAYDADATIVNITIDTDNQTVIIEDDGIGMGIKEVNDYFLRVGVDKREQQFRLTPIFRRPVMGRKGIGKLSIFSVADDIEVHTKKVNSSGMTEQHAFLLRRLDIEEKLKEEKDFNQVNNYRPKPIPFADEPLEKGTRLVLKNFKKAINHSPNFLKRRLARRFSVLGEKYNFSVKINGEEVGLEDRDYFDKLQFLWLIGNIEQDQFLEYDNIVKPFKRLDGKLENSNYEIKGWIGTVRLPSDLKSDDESNNNKISLITRGKLSQEDTLDVFKEGRIFSEYIIGEIEADFLDLDDQDDIATSSRQKYDEDNERYKLLLKHIEIMLKKIGNEWTSLRNAELHKQAISTATKDIPALREWFDELKDAQKPIAQKMFATIQGLHLGSGNEASKKRKEFYKQGIYAFEKLSLQQNLNELEKITSSDDFKLAEIFTNLSDIEAALYYDITQERIRVIRAFNDLVEENVKEKVLQKYLFDNLWLLHPSWERATQGTEILEQNVKKAFGDIDVPLEKDEKSGRLDIAYRTYSDKHIIIELKRYKTNYTINKWRLAEQTEKYVKALKKCLEATGKSNPQIEAIIVIGTLPNGESRDEMNKHIREIPARIVLYDELIEQSLEAYKTYLNREKKITKLREIIDKIEATDT